MKLFKLNQIGPVKTHIFEKMISEKYIYGGGLVFLKPGERAHTNEGHNGEDTHIHTQDEVIMVMQGKGYQEIEQERIPLAAGDVIIIEKGENHHLVSDVNDPIAVIYAFGNDQRNEIQKPR